MSYARDALIDSLERENAVLRVERDEWHRVAKGKQDIIDHMRDDRAENAKLRERVAELEKLTNGKRCVRQEWYALLETENAKLRKLVADYDATLLQMCDQCDTCVLSEGEYRNCKAARLSNLMREMGIEAEVG